MRLQLNKELTEPRHHQTRLQDLTHRTASHPLFLAAQPQLPCLTTVPFSKKQHGRPCGSSRRGLLILILPGVFSSSTTSCALPFRRRQQRLCIPRPVLCPVRPCCAAISRSYNSPIRVPSTSLLHDTQDHARHTTDRHARDCSRITSSIWAIWAASIA